jgi:hypothetical protein
MDCAIGPCGITWIAVRGGRHFQVVADDEWLVAMM